VLALPQSPEAIAYFYKEAVIALTADWTWAYYMPALLPTAPSPLREVIFDPRQFRGRYPIL
jgi:hypothetical protein